MELFEKGHAEEEYAFGSPESQQDLAVVPPGSTVYYEVELASFVKDKESCDMSNGEKIIAASKTKEKAADFSSTILPSVEEKKQAKTLKASCNLTMQPAR